MVGYGRVIGRVMIRAAIGAIPYCSLRPIGSRAGSHVGREPLWVAVEVVVVMMLIIEEGSIGTACRVGVGVAFGGRIVFREVVLVGGGVGRQIGDATGACGGGGVEDLRTQW